MTSKNIVFIFKKILNNAFGNNCKLRHFVTKENLINLVLEYKVIDYVLVLNFK